MSTHLLDGKNVVLFGAGGSLGKVTAQTFMEHGANVSASSRSVDGLEEISGLQNVRAVDALNENQVADYLNTVATKQGSVDAVLNLATTDHSAFSHGHPAANTSLEDLLLPARTTLGAQFVTAKMAHPIMSKQGSGAIIFITSTLAVVGSPWSAALSATHAGIEGLMKSLASEWGGDGIRVLGVRSEAMPETPTIEYTFRTMGANMGLSGEEMQGFIEQNKTALSRLPSRRETANLLAFAASDLASFMTGTMLNNSGGHVLQ